MIQINKYQVSINDSFLFQVDEFQIQKEKIYYLLGKNGCGKSTFLKSILSQSKKNGSLQIDTKDQATYSPKELAKKIAYVPSKLEINDYTFVEDFLLIGRYPHGKPFSGISQRDAELISETLRLLEIESLQYKRLNELSDGQQQLVSIGRAIVQEVDYILLDEPTAFLDFLNKIKIMSLIKKLSETKQIGFVIVTHDVEFVFKQKTDIYYIDSRAKKMTKIPFLSQLDFDQTVQLIYGE